MSKYYKYEKGVTVKKLSNGRDEIFFDGWSIKKDGNKYFTSYISSEHGGGERTFTISKKDYLEAKALNIGLLELINKYHLQDN